MKTETCYVVGHGNETRFFFNRGPAIDTGLKALEKELYVPDDYVAETSGKQTIYVGRDGDKFAYAATKEILKELGFGKVFGNKMDMTKYDDEHGDEYTVMMTHDKERGYIFCRINPDHNYYGHTGLGIRCFPDREWKTPALGEHKVKITKCHGKFAFITGSPVDFTYDNLDGAISYLCKHSYDGEAIMRKVDSKLHGVYYMIDKERITADGTVPLKGYDIDDAMINTVWEGPLNEVALHCEWHDTTLNSIVEEILGDYTAPEFDLEEWMLVYPREAELAYLVSIGLIKAYKNRKTGAMVYTVNKKRLYVMAEFPQEYAYHVFDKFTNKSNSSIAV